MTTKPNTLYTWLLAIGTALVLGFLLSLYFLAQTVNGQPYTSPKIAKGAQSLMSRSYTPSIIGTNALGMSIYAPRPGANTNGATPRWISITFTDPPVPPTNHMCYALERSDDLMHWKFYQAVPWGMTNWIWPNDGGTHFYRWGTNPVTVIYPSN